MEGAINKLITLAVALSITTVLAVMLWAQAGQFPSDAPAVRSEVHDSSRRSPYPPMRTLKPVGQQRRALGAGGQLGPGLSTCHIPCCTPRQGTQRSDLHCSHSIAPSRGILQILGEYSAVVTGACVIRMCARTPVETGFPGRLKPCAPRDVQAAVLPSVILRSFSPPCASQGFVPALSKAPDTFASGADPHDPAKGGSRCGCVPVRLMV
jgi:hypothetical protein